MTNTRTAATTATTASGSARLRWVLGLTSTGLIATGLAPRLLPESHGAPEQLDLVGVTLVTAGVVAMALPTVPTAVLNAVTPTEMGKASGINYMAQRLGTVLAIAIGSAMFSAHGQSL